jgi:hypothetical protein
MFITLIATSPVYPCQEKTAFKGFQLIRGICRIRGDCVTPATVFKVKFPIESVTVDNAPQVTYTLLIDLPLPESVTVPDMTAADAKDHKPVSAAIKTAVLLFILAFILFGSPFYFARLALISRSTSSNWFFLGSLKKHVNAARTISAALGSTLPLFLIS